MKKRRIIVYLLVLVLCLSLSGCGKKEVVKPAFGTADNEILTYRRLDPEKTPLVIGVSGNIFIGVITKVFMERNPDIQIIPLNITGGNDITIPVRDWMVKGYRPDILLWSGNPNNIVNTSEMFEDLSASSLVELYETEALDRVSVDGHLYVLPGPSQISCFTYNKDIFDEHGWEEPKTFDEFVELCVRIKEETGGAIQPWNPNAKYANVFISALEAFTYTEILGGAENRTWYNEYLLGNAKYSDNMQPFYDAYQKLVDAEIFKEEYFSYSATTRGKEFNEGKIAFYNQAISDEPGEGEVFMPFLGKTEDDAYIIEAISYGIGVPIKERDEKTKDAIDRFLKFYTSEEAQRIYIGDKIMLSNIKGVACEAIENMPAVRDAVNSGHVFAWVDFKAPGMSGSYNALNHIRADLLAIFKGEMTAEESMAHMDELTAQVLSGEYETELTTLATAAEDFTILETSNYFADLYREKSGAEIGLITNNNAFRGNLMRIFKGDITDSDVEVLKPRSFENGSTLVKLKMTGKQLLDALNDPVSWDEDAEDMVTYAFSGLKCEVAPWNENGKKMVSVKLSDGSDIDEAREYTVGCWAGTIHDKYITETLETFEGTFEQQLTEKLLNDKVISPAKDGRIKLIWE